MGDFKRKLEAVLVNDTGLLNFLPGIQADLVGIYDLSTLPSGKIVQHLITQEIMAQFKSPLFKPMFWVRENANSSAEVNLVLPVGKYLIPIEVKSGKQGRLRSLHEFIDRTAE